MRFVSLFVALMLSGALIAACGDDDDDEALSKSEYVRQGNAVCADWARDFNKLFEEGFPTTQSALTRFFGRATPLFEKRMRGLRALEAPEADEAQVNGFLAAGDKAVSDFRKASSDPKLAKRIFDAEGGKNGEAFTKQAQAYGLSKCEEEDDDDGEEAATLDPSTFPADKRAFVEKLDERCRESDKQTDALEQRYLKRFPPPISGWAEFLPRLVKVLRADTEFARGVTPPAADKAKVEELLDTQDEFVDKLDEAGKAAQEGDEKTVGRLTREVFSESDNFDEELRKYGFQVCGQDDDDDDDEEENEEE